MSTQEAFEKAYLEITMMSEEYLTLARNDTDCTTQRGRNYHVNFLVWQASQANNAKDIAELVEALEVMTPIYNQLAWIAVCWNDHNFDANSIYTKINTAFNEAGFKRGEGVEPVNNFVEKLEALIAKHKGQS